MSPRNKIIPIFVPHLGCPNQCVFCDQRRISGSLFPASAESVRIALEGLEGTGYEAAFYGGSFTAIPAERQEELLAALAPWRENGIVTSVRLSTRPDAVDETVTARLRRWGVGTVELGAQSMTEEVLRLSGRGHTAQDTENACRLLKAGGFRVVLQMMTGLPGETAESSLDTARRLIALGPDGVRIYPTVIVRGTPLEELWRRGEYREHTVEEAVELCARLLPLFDAAGIPVIRLGLNPTDALSGGDALAGAYHPALGELVRSRVLRNKAEVLLSDIAPGSAVTLGVAERCLSQMTGQRRENLRWLRRRFALAEVRVRSADVPPGEIVRLEVANGREML